MPDGVPAGDDQWNTVMKWLRFRVWMKPLWKGRTQDCGYTVGALESMIYTPAPPHQQDKLLNIHEIFPMDSDTQDPRAVLRFLMDWRVKVADSALLVMILSTVVCAPLTFIWGGSWDEPKFVPGGRSLLVVDTVLDMAYALYLLLRLNVSFLHPARHAEIVDRRQILLWWLGSPLYWVQLLSSTSNAWIIAGAPTFVNNIKCVRLVHLVRFPDSLWQLDDKAFVRVLRPLVLLLACSHWTACLMAFLGGYRLLLLEGQDAGGTPWNVTFYLGGKPIPKAVTLYMMAFVESLYMLTGGLDNPLGDGGPRNQNLAALIVVSIFGPVGCVVVALFISAVVREQSMEHALDMRHHENKAFMQRALRILAIPVQLQWRVLSMHYYQKMGHDLEAFNQLFNKRNLSPPLESALLVYLYREMVCNSRYFRNKDPNYVIAVIRILDNQVFLPGDYVARRGEVASVMYFVSRGQLSILVPDASASTRLSRSTQVGSLKQGDHFGEIALVQQSTRTAWVRAETYVLVAALWRERMEGLWRYFESEHRELTAMVLETASADRRRAAVARWRKVGSPEFRRNMLQATKEGAGTKTAGAEDAEMGGVGVDDAGDTAAGMAAGAAAAAAGDPAWQEPRNVPAGNLQQDAAEGHGKPASAASLMVGVLHERLGELLQRQTALEASVWQALAELRAAAPPLAPPEAGPPEGLRSTMTGAAALTADPAASADSPHRPPQDSGKGRSPALAPAVAQEIGTEVPVAAAASTPAACPEEAHPAPAGETGGAAVPLASEGPAVGRLGLQLDPVRPEAVDGRGRHAPQGPLVERRSASEPRGQAKQLDNRKRNAACGGGLPAPRAPVEDSVSIGLVPTLNPWRMCSACVQTCCTPADDRLDTDAWILSRS